MQTLQTFNYLAARAHKLRRSIFRNEAGALTLEWLVIAAALVVAVGIAAGIFNGAIRAAANKLK